MRSATLDDGYQELDARNITPQLALWPGPEGSAMRPDAPPNRHITPIDARKRRGNWAVVQSVSEGVLACWNSGECYTP
jgi:hypothetical protein